MTQIHLVTDDPDLTAQIQNAIDPAGGDVDAVSPPVGSDSLVAFAKQLIDDDPLVVILHLDGRTQDLFEVAAEIDRLRGDIGLIYITPPTSEAMRQALRTGVRELLPPDATAADISEAVERVTEVAVRRRAERSLGDDGASSTRTIAVLSPKGGVGKTMLSTNLAVGLAAVHPREVCLVDLDLQFGDVANTLRIVPEHTIHDAVDKGLADATALKLDLAPHPSGVYALCAPDDPAEADEISAAHVSRTIALLASSFSYVILDTDPGLGEYSLAAIDQATDLVFVCATDVASVRGLNKELKALDNLGLTEAKRHFVLNRSDAKVGLSVEAISDTVDLSVDVFVPSSRAVPLAMNQGLSLLEGDESTVTKSLWQLVRRFTNASLPIDADAKSSKFLRRN